MKGALAAAAVAAAYFARPWSCAAVLALEVRRPDDRYDSVDPHGFGVMGAFASAVLFAAPVLWLLLQRRAPAPAPVAPGAWWGRSTAITLVLGSPMLLQLTYLSVPFAASWPMVASSAAWLMAVAALCLVRGPGLPSAHAAFEHRPRVAWAVLAGVAAAKLAFVPPLVQGYR